MSEGDGPKGRPSPEEHERFPGLVESVHHHLRTPLAVVLGYSELLVDLEHELPAEVHHALATLHRAAQRLNDVVLGVCDLVALACVEPEAEAPVDISHLVREAVESCQGRAVARGVRLLVGDGGSQTCTTDARRLRRALRELLDNAVTWARDESTVRVAWTFTNAGIQIEVSEQEDGTTADLEPLVAPFERCTHPRRPVDGQGMGLDLAAVVAASLGGRLLLSDGPGAGLRACIELPVDVMHLDHAAVAEAQE